MAADAGWYDDVHQPGQMRWWDGTEWTEHRAPIPGPAAVTIASDRALAKAARKAQSEQQKADARALAEGKKTEARAVAESKKADKRAQVELAQEQKRAQLEQSEAEHNAEIDRRIDDALVAAKGGYIRAESTAIRRAREIAKRHGGRKELQTLDARIRELEVKNLLFIDSRDIGVVHPENVLSQYGRTQKVLSVQPGKPIHIFSDRIIQDGTAYPLDGTVQAQVYLDGQIQITQRPTLTRMALLSPLPGSAILGGLALQKKTRNDDRTAHFQVAGTDWSLIVPIDPDRVSGPRALAVQVNALSEQAAQKAAAATASAAAHVSNPPVAAPPAQPDVMDQLERLHALLQAGGISAEEAAVLRDRLLNG